MEKNPFEIMKHLEPQSMKLPENEFAKAGQIQQNSTPNLQKTNKVNFVETNYLQTEKTRDVLQKDNYTPSLIISKQKYIAMMKHRPLIKFKPIRNCFIKQGDLSILAENLNVPKNMVNTVINDIISYMLYMNEESMYYNPEIYKQNEYMQMLLQKDEVMKGIIDANERKREEKNYYIERAEVIGPYIYRHGSKQQLTDYMKYELSNAKTALKNLYNILETEGRGLYYYFERPIHVCDNRTLKKMQHIIKEGLSNARDKGYITNDIYEQNVEWAIQKIYDIQSNNNLREALRVAIESR